MFIVWKLHPVISVVQLKPLPPGENLYHRLKSIHFPAVEMQNDIPDNQSYKIKKLVDKRIRKYNKTNVVQYLMKWLKYAFEYNQCKNIAILNNCLDLVKKNETGAPILVPIKWRKSRD